jgi:hypothetical protein
VGGESTFLSCALGHSGKTSGVVISEHREDQSMRSFLISILFGALSAATACTGVQAQSANTRVAAMPFAECLSIIHETSQEMGEEPVQLVNSNDLVSVRINASDGFVTVSCDRSASKITLTKSPVPEAAGLSASR